MVNLASVKSYLNVKKSLLNADQDTQAQQQPLLEWAAALSRHSEGNQAFKLEQMLVKLAALEIDDEQQLAAMTIVSSASDRLVTRLHSHYFYDLEALNDEQLNYADQVKSFYYLTLLVYDKMLRRQDLTASYLAPQPIQTLRQRWSQSKQPVPLVLAAAIYQTLSCYQKLSYEKAICYQKSPEHIWSALNQLYYLAYQQGIAHVNLSAQIATKQADSIHELYVQMCLFSLLNVRAMPRANIILMQRLLPTWIPHVAATIKPQTHTRVFVDLHSDLPPEYLTPQTAINPYHEKHDCLFIELAPLARHFAQRKQLRDYNGIETTEYPLIEQALRLITYRYIDRPSLANKKQNTEIEAEIITKFDNIHYKIAGNTSLSQLVMPESLPPEHLPRYDTGPKTNSKPATFKVKLFDDIDMATPFSTLQLLSKLDPEQPVAHASSKPLTRAFEASQKNTDKLLTSLTLALTECQQEIDNALANEKREKVSLPLLQLETLLLLNHSTVSDQPNYLLGVVRWLDLDKEQTPVEWQLLGQPITACALRLNKHDASNISYVAALLIASRVDSQSKNTLVVPSHHFHTLDKVVIRIKNKQKTLRLQRCLLSTQTFSQYEFDIITL